MADRLDLPLIVNSAVVSKRMENGAVLVDSATGACFELNRVGADIWTDLQRGERPTRIAELLAIRHGISTDQATADLRSLVDQLLRQGLLRTADER